MLYMQLESFRLNSEPDTTSIQGFLNIHCVPRAEWCIPIEAIRKAFHSMTGLEPDVDLVEMAALGNGFAAADGIPPGRTTACRVIAGIDWKEPVLLKPKTQTIKDFIQSHCKPDPDGCVPVPELREAAVPVLAEPVSNRIFGRMLREIGLKITFAEINRKTVRVVKGLRWRNATR